MGNLVAVAYPSEHVAAEAMATLRRLYHERTVEVDDAVVLIKDAHGKLTLAQSLDASAAGAAGAAFWGRLFGLIFLMPVAGLAIGSTSGALLGTLSDNGVDGQFINDLSSQLPPRSSAIFLLVRRATPDQAIAAIQDLGGTAIRTALPAAEERPSAALGGPPAGGRTALTSA